MATAPEVPTIAESGVPGFDVSTWFALFAPAGTPKPVIERISAETARTMLARDFVERLQSLGMNPAPGSPEALAAHVASELGRWAKVVREANIKVE